MSKKILVIAAHPDDEILGAGGTLLKHNNQGDQVEWLIATSIFEHQGFSKERIEERQREIETVAKMMSFKQVYQLGYPTMSLDSTSLIKMIPEIASIFHTSKPHT